MHQRLDAATASPALYATFIAVEGHLRASIDHGLYELLKLRASMINGCAFCIDMHSRDALASGETIERIVALPAWRESPWYTDVERSVLALTDAITTLGPDGVPDEVWDDAAARFDDRQLADLVGAASMINLWNRLSISTRKLPAGFTPPAA